MSLRETMTVRGLRGFGAAVAAVLVLSGCGTSVSGTVPTPAALPARTPTPKVVTPTPTPAPNPVFVPGPPAIPITAQEGAATVGVRRYSWRPDATGAEASPPANGYLVLEVVVTATAGRVQVNPLYFTVRTPGGDELETVLGADGNEPVLASRELNAPEAVDGIVTFDTAREDVTVLIADELGNRVGEIHLPRPPA